MHYEFVAARSPAHAVYAVHREALGPNQVWLQGGQIRFADAAMQGLCAGVKPHIPNDRRRRRENGVDQPAGELSAAPRRCP
jgi:hypothetical protein